MVSLSCASRDEHARVRGSAQSPAPSHGQDSILTHIPNEPPRRAVLAIDYGRRRIGLAVSDALSLTARPLATWTRVNRRRDLAMLRDLCRAHDVGVIVVGSPLHLDGRQSEMAGETARFAERIRKHIGLPVELVDERLSSWEAKEVLAKAALPRRSQQGGRQRKPVDDVAAAVILRDYLSRGTCEASSVTHRHTRTAAPSVRSVPSRPALQGPGRN